MKPKAPHGRSVRWQLARAAAHTKAWRPETSGGTRSERPLGVPQECTAMNADHADNGKWKLPVLELGLITGNVCTLPFGADRPKPKPRNCELQPKKMDAPCPRHNMNGETRGLLGGFHTSTTPTRTQPQILNSGPRQCQGCNRKLMTIPAASTTRPTYMMKGLL